MKTLKKWMMMSVLAASLFGFAGCALFGGLSSGSSSSQSKKRNHPKIRNTRFNLIAL